MAIHYKTKPDTPNQLNTILHPLVQQWFFQTYPVYSQAQLFGVMPIHNRQNMLLSAPTGSTKTLTAFLAILNYLVDCSLKGILEEKTYALYISPLRALNSDIEQNLVQPLKQIEKIHGASLGIRVGVRSSDTTAYERQQMKKKPPHILITTPESLAILLVHTPLQVEWIIVDEIHALADNKRGVHLNVSMERLTYVCRIGLSATVAPLQNVAQFLVGPKRDCIIIQVPYKKQLDLQVCSPVDDFVLSDFATIDSKTYAMIHELIQQHKTTLIFTNTRAGTERVVHTLKKKYPTAYYELGEHPPVTISSLIGAHHGSLSREHRYSIEQKLRDGKLKCVVCSTSLELGIDIGYIDLVILLGSPKSTARLLQRVGRSGHQLHAVTKGKIIVQDRDDLFECAVMLKEAIEGHIDTIHIPTLCFDVLIQHILGMALQQTWDIQTAYNLITQSYCYEHLTIHQFMECLRYLSADTLQDQHVYAKIWVEHNQFGKRGKMTKMIYYTNSGTIVDQGGMSVKLGNYIIGHLDEAFVEQLKPGDIFVLGGDTYQFKYARGMTATVQAAPNKTPTVPQWFSEMLPLSFDVGHAISLCKQKIEHCLPDIDKAIEMVQHYLYVDKNAAQALVHYCYVQYEYSKITTTKHIVIEYYQEDQKYYACVLLSAGRKTNELLARALAYAVSKKEATSVEISVSDHGFYLASPIPFALETTWHTIEDIVILAQHAIENSELLKRRFRQCASRSYMILRNYRGQKRGVGKQQVSSSFLLNAIKQMDNNFIVLQETRREAIQDVMDATHAKQIHQNIRKKEIMLHPIHLSVTSPFAFHIISKNRSDVFSLEDRQTFLQRMHNLVLVKLAQQHKTTPYQIQPIQYEWLPNTQKKAVMLSVQEKFQAIAHKIGVDAIIIYEIKQKMEYPTKPLCTKTKQWIQTLLQGTVPKIWEDDVVQALQELL
ncbi:MAG: ATP-dependent helicase [Candidatus Woesearchaeota archaeon]